MISLKKRAQGFTIIELVIVIAVIAILVAIVLTTYSGIQAKARNASREKDIDTMQTQLESFYSQNQYYPSLTDLDSAKWRANNMPKLSDSAMEDPSENGTPVLVANNSNNHKDYAYAVSNTPMGGTAESCENDDTTCNTYTLTAQLEGGGTYTKNNVD